MGLLVKIAIIVALILAVLAALSVAVFDLGPLKELAIAVVILCVVALL
jgi:hypothetical protein